MRIILALAFLIAGCSEPPPLHEVRGHKMAGGFYLVCAKNRPRCIIYKPLDGESDTDAFTKAISFL